MKTAISIPDRQFKAAERLARRLGMTRSELYQAAVAEFLSKHGDNHVTEKLDDLFKREGKSPALPHDAARMQARSLADENW